MKSTTLALIIIIGIVAAGAFFFTKGGIVTGNAVESSQLDNSNGEVQKVVIGMKDYNYYPNTIKVKANQPVSISLDKTAVGCSRYFTIPQLKLSKNLATPSDTLDFTPQKGTYRFQCGMGMYYGTLIAE